jgi:anti-sigma regulatory factor (Ser/Thr protein kinase)
MIEELDMHLLDLVQNAFTAGASEVEVRVRCDAQTDRLTLEVSDNGRGMDEPTLQAVRRGYYSSKSSKSVGLGIPLLRETAEHCNGRFLIESRVGKGTTVVAEFQMSHMDLPPFGDLAATFLAMLVTTDASSVRINYRCDGRALDIDTASMSDLLGDVPLQHPEVVQFLKGYIQERIHEP